MSNNGLKHLYRIYCDYKRKKILKKYAEIGDSIDIGINLRVDNPPHHKSKLLTVGDGCIINANFVFESGNGNVVIGDNTFIGGCTIISHNNIIIGNFVQIAWGTYLYDHNAHSTDLRLRRNDILNEYKSLSIGNNDTANKDWSIVKSRPIIVEDDVWIGMNALILSGVSIGRGSVVGAGAVVRKSVPPFCIVMGNPARVVKFIYKPEEIEDVQKAVYPNSEQFLSQKEYQDLINLYENKVL